MNVGDRMYRYVDVSYAAPFDDEGRQPGTVKVELRAFEVVRCTAKTAWLVPENLVGWAGVEPKVIRLGARRRFACATVEEARASFLVRKRRQLGILRAQIAHVERALADLERQNPTSLGERIMLALKERPMRNSELLRAAAVVDRRTGEDVIYSLVRNGDIVVGPDSVMRWAGRS